MPERNPESEVEVDFDPGWAAFISFQDEFSPELVMG